MGIRDTSIAAYMAIKPTLGYRQEEVLTALKQLGSATNLEISRFLDIPINQITPRTNELVKMELVGEKQKRTCTISKRRCIAWEVF